MAAPDQNPARFVNPVGTVLRGWLGRRDEGFEWRVVAMLQLAALALVLRSTTVAIALVVVVDALSVTAVVRYRASVRAWRGRAWRFSERAWWL